MLYPEEIKEALAPVIRQVRLHAGWVLVEMAPAGATQAAVYGLVDLSRANSTRQDIEAGAAQPCSVVPDVGADMTAPNL